MKKCDNYLNEIEFFLRTRFSVKNSFRNSSLWDAILMHTHIYVRNEANMAKQRQTVSQLLYVSLVLPHATHTHTHAYTNANMIGRLPA